MWWGDCWEKLRRSFEERAAASGFFCGAIYCFVLSVVPIYFSFMRLLYFLLLILTANLCIVSAFAQGTGWAQTVNGPHYEYNRTVATDAAGNTYATGSFTNTTTVGGTVLQSSGSSTYSSYVVKYNAQGVLQWVLHPTATDANSYAEVLSIATDPNGNLLIAGYFERTSCRIGSTLLTADPRLVNSSHGYIAKISPQGMVVWAERIAYLGAGTEASAITTDAVGNVYVGGAFDFQRLFISKYAASGGPALFNRISAATPGFITVTDIAASANGQQLAITGVAGNGLVSLSDASGTGLAVPINAPNGFGPSGGSRTAGYIAGYSATGMPQWAQVVRDTDDEASLNRIVSSGTDFFVCGNYTSNATFGTAPAIALPLTSGLSNGFSARINGQGLVQWVNRIQGSQFVYARDVAVDAAGNAYVGCSFSAQMNVLGRILSSAGQLDVVIMAYAPQGTIIGAQRDGGAALDDLGSLVIDAVG